MRHYRLFQAWQNQDKEYTDFITRTIREVVEIEKSRGIEVEVIRFPAQDEAGSPDVVDMVWEQIANSDIFVGDLTGITNVGDCAVSNPNVMYEVGIADSLLGEKRVILLCSKDTEINRLAFDINHKRISPLNKKNTQAADFLCEWIDAAILECDIQQVQRDFVLKDLYDDLYVVYNNLMRIVYSEDYNYSLGVVPPGIENIETNLQTAVLNELMLVIDYSCVIDRLKTEIRALYDSNNRRYLGDIINIYKALDKYNWFVHATQKSVLLSENEEKYSALLQDTKAFYLTAVEGAEESYGSILFDKKYIYINGEPPFQNVYLREMFTDEVKVSCHLQNVPVGDSELTALKTKTYMLTPEAVSSYSKYLNDVLIAIYTFMDKMNYYPTKLIPDIKCNTIIVWDKSK
ncbi:uncharacterized protein BN781_00810 [Coprococcus sp. CAG:782]|nr:hypothetical protein [Coprococcus sp.]CCY54288.1 uncharacterized protein BN781_00810 [Coprococcus sp. CAG:782]